MVACRSVSAAVLSTHRSRLAGPTATTSRVRGAVTNPTPSEPLAGTHWYGGSAAQALPVGRSSAGRLEGSGAKDTVPEAGLVGPSEPPGPSRRATAEACRGGHEVESWLQTGS